MSRFCSGSPRCGAIVDKGVCARCARRLGRTSTLSAARRGYTRAWRTYAADWLSRHPTCGERADGRLYPDDSTCVQQGTRTRATVADHILAQRAGGAHCAPSNTQSLCSACNKRKAIRHEGGVGYDGLR